MDIRYATMDDYDGICHLMEQIDRLHREQHPNYFRKADPTREPAYIQSWLDDELLHLVVAEEEGSLVGAIMFELRTVPEIPIIHPRQYVLVDTLVVDEAARGKGIGTALMKVAHNWAREHGIYEMELGVFAFNTTALRLYEKLGYKIIRHRMSLRLDCG